MPSAALSPDQLQTRILYELVATGRDFYREQRVGYWQLTWERSASGKFQVQNWQALDETQSRANAPGYVDIAAPALGGNMSYSSQLLPGTQTCPTMPVAAAGLY